MIPCITHPLHDGWHLPTFGDFYGAYSTSVYKDRDTKSTFQEIRVWIWPLVQKTKFGYTYIQLLKIGSREKQYRGPSSGSRSQNVHSSGPSNALCSRALLASKPGDEIWPLAGLGLEPAAEEVCVGQSPLRASWVTTQRCSWQHYLLTEAKLYQRPQNVAGIREGAGCESTVTNTDPQTRCLSGPFSYE